jgi:hypothetical protein
MPVILAIGRLRLGRSYFEVSTCKEFKRPPSPKITRAKWTGGVD